MDLKETVTKNINQKNAALLIMVSFALVLFVASVSAAINVALNAPVDGANASTLGLNFTFTPVISGENDTYLNCSLWTNASGLWAFTGANVSAVNDSVPNNINYSFASSGKYLWNIECVDNGTSSYFDASNRTLIADNVAPAVPSITPNSGSFKGSILFNVSVTDAATGVKNVSLTLHSISANVNYTAEYLSLTSGTANDGYWTKTIDVSSVIVDNYTVYVNATDYAGNNNVALSSANIIIDNKAPKINFTTPGADNVRMYSLFNFTVNVSDLSPLQSVQIQNGTGGNWINMAFISTVYDGLSVTNHSTYSYVLNLSQLTEGSHQIRINATDQLGNYNDTTYINITNDKTPPTITHVQPINGLNSSNTVLTYNFSASDNYAPNVDCTLYYGVSNNSWTDITAIAYTAPAQTQGIYSWNVTCYDKAASNVVSGNGNAGMSASSWNYTIDTSTPYFVYYSPIVGGNYSSTVLSNVTAVDGGSGIQYFYVRIENDTDVTGWQNMNLDAGTILNGNWSYTFASGSIADGLYNVTLQATDYTGSHQNMTYTQITIDNTPPIFSSVNEPTDPSTYVSGQTYYFNATITDATTSVSSVWYNWNGSGTNSTDVTVAGNIYKFNKTNLAAGTYSYIWYANNSAGLVNYTNGTFTVSPATPVLTAAVSTPKTYGDAAGYSAGESNAGDGGCDYMLFRNSTYVMNGSSVTDNAVLAAGTYLYNYTTAGCENYTAASNVTTLVVDKDTALIGLYLNDTWNVNLTMTYGAQLNATVETDFGTAKMYRNGTDVTNESNTFVTLAAGYYVYVANTTGDENHSANTYPVRTVTIDKATGNVTLTLNGTAGDITQTYGATVTPVATGTGNVTIYRNGTIVANNTAVGLAAGVYNYTAIVGNENYTTETITRIATVNQATPALVGSVASTPITYGDAAGYAASESNAGDGGCDYMLFRNSTYVMNGSSVTDNAVLAAGTYLYNYSTAGCANYSAVSNITTLVVNKALSLIYFYVNGTWDAAANVTMTYGGQVNASAWSDFGPVVIYRNGTNVTSENNTFITLGVGDYNYTAIALGDENHSPNTYPTRFVIISKAIGSVNLSLNGTFGDITQTYGSTVTPVATGTGNVTIYKNGSVAVNNTPVTLGAGVYNYTAIVGNENYTTATITRIATVSQATPAFSSSVTTPIIYGAASDYTASESNTGDTDCVYTLYRNANYVTSGSSVNDPSVLGGTTAYTYNYSTAGCANYSAAQNITTLTVNPANQLLTLTFNPSATVTYGTTTAAVMGGCNSTCALYRNTTLATGNDSRVLAAGTYNYTYNSSSNNNFTANSTSATLTVNKANGTIYTYINNSRANATIQAYTSVTLNATLMNGSTTIYLYSNGTEVTNGASPLYNLKYYDKVGTYAITANHSGEENFTAGNETWTLTVQDTIAPNISSATITNTSTGVAVTTNIGVTFSEPMNSSTVTNATFTLKTAAGTAVVGSVATSDNQTFTFAPASSLAYSTDYNATITTAVKDVNGNNMTAQYVLTFTTAAAPASSSTVTPVLGAPPTDSQTSTFSITAGTETTVTYTSLDIPITEITITTDKTGSASIKVTDLGATPPSGTPAAPGSVYTYLQVDESGFTNANLESVNVEFRVPASWFTTNGFETSVISLSRFANGVWTSYPATVVKSENGYYYFSVDLPGLSYLVITADGNILDKNYTYQPSAQETACINAGGTVTTAMCCASTEDFPRMDLVGACGCSPVDSHEVKVCACSSGKEWNGTACSSGETLPVTPPITTASVFDFNTIAIVIAVIVVLALAYVVMQKREKKYPITGGNL